MIRILILINNFPPRVGGAEKLAESLFREFQELGHETLVITRWTRGVPVFLNSGLGKVYRIPVFGPRFLRSIIYRIGACLLLLTFRNRFDCVHSHSLDAPSQLASLMCPLLKKRLFITIHNVDKVKAYSQRKGGLSSWQRILNSTDAFISINPGISDELKEFGCPESKIFSIANGVDTDVFRPGVRCPNTARKILPANVNVEGRVVFLFVGVFQHQKGIDLMLKAWGSFLLGLKEQENPLLLVVGSGEGFQDMIRLSNDLELGSSICFLGMRADVAELLPIADVFVQPSRWEGLSIALLEAMSTGLAILATEVKGNQSVLVNRFNSLTVPVENIPALADGMLELFKGPELRQELGAKARIAVMERFSIKNCANLHLDLLSR